MKDGVLIHMGHSARKGTVEVETNEREVSGAIHGSGLYFSSKVHMMMLCEFKCHEIRELVPAFCFFLFSHTQFGGRIQYKAAGEIVFM